MSGPNMSLLGGATESNGSFGSPPSPGAIEHFMDDLGPMQEADDLPDLFAGLARAVMRALKADAVLVSMYEPERSVLRDVAASVIPPAALNSVVEEYVLEDFPATRAVIETGKPLEISRFDPTADPSERRYLTEYGFARSLICRISLDGDGIGVVEVYRLRDLSFREDDPRQIDLLAKFAANAYSRIQMATKLESHYTETMEALVSALEARDPYTEAHAGRIKDIAVALAVALKVPGDSRRAVKLGAILHDVGKIGVSDSILLKPGALNDEEWKIMRSHPAIGERMLRGIDFLQPALPIIRHHHERWDGRGYPDGLTASNIPIGARIVAVCDTFDAMTSDRPYRKALPLDQACAEIDANSGSQFDPTCARLLVEVMSSMGEVDLEDKFVRYAS